MKPHNDLPLAWLTGAGGLIGSHLAAQVPSNWRLRALARGDLELLDHAAVVERFKRERPSLVIHCAAVSKAAACQADPALARRLNVDATRLLAELGADARIVFLSSDLVFDGRRGRSPENAIPNPLHLYGETKAAAEEVLRRHPRHLIVRTSLNYGTSPTGDRAFNEEMLAAVRAGRRQKLFTDEFRCPIAVEDTARLIWALIGAAATGIHHVAGGERLSRWEIGQRLLGRHLELAGQLEPASLREFSGPPRAPDTSLDCGKTERLLGEAMPCFLVPER